MPSKLHGIDHNGIVQFLDDDYNGSKLRYKDKDGTVHSVFLCDIGNSCASNFRIMTSDGIRALGKV